jgi:hypothetical protein
MCDDTDYGYDLNPTLKTSYTLHSFPDGLPEGLFELYPGIPPCEQKENARKVSAEWAGFLIVVTGSGRNYPDVWMSAFLDGESVWEWSLADDGPSIPPEIRERAKASFEVGEAKRKQQRIAELKKELEQLESDQP